MGKERQARYFLHWMDDGLTPDSPEELGADEKMGDDGGGAIIIVTKGKMMCSTYGIDATLLPLSRLKEVNMAPVMKRVPEGHYVQWVNACIASFGKNELSSTFDYAGPLTKTILMGNFALHSWNIKDSKSDFPGRKKLIRDTTNIKVANFDMANQFVRRSYRPGFSFEL